MGCKRGVGNACAGTMRVGRCRAGMSSGGATEPYVSTHASRLSSMSAPLRYALLALPPAGSRSSPKRTRVRHETPCACIAYRPAGSFAVGSIGADRLRPLALAHYSARGLRALVQIVEVPMVALGTISHPSSFTAYGVDGCRAGWFFVALEPCGGIRWGVVPILADLVRTVGDSDRIFVDIPIGLPEGAESRTCDRDARRRLGRRGSSVFPAPARQVVGIDSFEDANRTSRAVAGKGISRQTFAIVQKVREIDSALRRCSKARRLVREVHPEVCFWALARETPMSVRKKVKEGFRERVSVLTNLRPSAGDEVSQIARPFRRKQVSWDDIADAFVAALTASQPLERLRTLPAVPEYDRYGLPMEMVYADVLSSHVAENLPASR